MKIVDLYMLNGKRCTLRLNIKKPLLQVMRISFVVFQVVAHTDSFSSVTSASASKSMSDERVEKRRLEIQQKREERKLQMEMKKKEKGKERIL